MTSFASSAPGGSDAVKSFAAFEKSAVAGAKVPAELSDCLRALWYAKAGKWEESHEIAQDIKTPAGSWIHAHLHRVEGDMGNAGYWYRRAGKTMPEGLALDQEWSLLARELWRDEHGIEAGFEALTSATGLVATSEKPAAGDGEGVWDTVICRNGKELLRVPNARPVSFQPTGDVLLLKEAAADDDCRHFLAKVSTDAKIPPFGARKRIGGRMVTGSTWSGDGQRLVLTSAVDGNARHREEVVVNDSLSPQ